MDTFSELFCLCFLGFYSSLLLALVVAPLFRYARSRLLNRHSDARLIETAKASPLTKSADPNQDSGANSLEPPAAHSSAPE